MNTSYIVVFILIFTGYDNVIIRTSSDPNRKSNIDGIFIHVSLKDITFSATVNFKICFLFELLK